MVDPRISDGSTEGREHGPPNEIFLAPLLPPTFPGRYKILNMLLTANIC